MALEWFLDAVIVVCGDLELVVLKLSVTIAVLCDVEREERKKKNDEKSQDLN